MTLSVRTDAQISIFYDFFLSHVVRLFFFFFITCHAIWDHAGTHSFLWVLFQLKITRKARPVLKPSPGGPLASDGHSIPISNSAFSWAPSSSVQFPKFPLGLKADYQLLSMNSICSRPGCNHLTLSTYSQGLDVFL